MRRSFAMLAVALVALAGCGSSSSSDGPDAVDTTAVQTTAAPETSAPDVTAPTAETMVPDTSAVPGTTAAPDPARPYDVFVPSTYDGSTAMPLVILLHGFGASGAIQEAYFQLQPLAESRGFLSVHLDGTLNQIGRTFWNATDGCCGVASDVDDVGYIISVIDAVSAQYEVDPKRVFVMGHSNGGFMSYRLACEAADRIAAIASLAGATFADQSDCTPSEPVSVLQVHGTADGTIPYDGGQLPFMAGPFPAARQTVSTWAQYNGCDATATPGEKGLDLDQTLPGPETSTETFDGCPTGVDVSLWTIEGGSHIPNIALATPPYPLSEGMIDFLLSHPKP
jgi:polyhydroxybutyrate depolymerase